MPQAVKPSSPFRPDQLEALKAQGATPEDIADLEAQRQNQTKPSFRPDQLEALKAQGATPEDIADLEAQRQPLKPLTPKSLGFWEDLKKVTMESAPVITGTLASILAARAGMPPIGRAVAGATSYGAGKELANLLSGKPVSPQQSLESLQEGATAELIPSVLKPVVKGIAAVTVPSMKLMAKVPGVQFLKERTEKLIGSWWLASGKEVKRWIKEDTEKIVKQANDIMAAAKDKFRKSTVAFKEKNIKDVANLTAQIVNKSRSIAEDLFPGINHVKQQQLWKEAIPKEKTELTAIPTPELIKSLQELKEDVAVKIGGHGSKNMIAQLLDYMQNKAGESLTLKEFDAFRKEIGKQIRLGEAQGGISQHVYDTLYGSMYKDLDRMAETAGQAKNLKSAIAYSKKLFGKEDLTEIIEGAIKIGKTGEEIVDPSALATSLKNSVAGKQFAKTFKQEYDVAISTLKSYSESLNKLKTIKPPPFVPPKLPPIPGRLLSPEGYTPMIAVRQGRDLVRGGITYFEFNLFRNVLPEKIVKASGITAAELVAAEKDNKVMQTVFGKFVKNPQVLDYISKNKEKVIAFAQKAGIPANEISKILSRIFVQEVSEPVS